jgi:hypothetical protein
MERRRGRKEEEEEEEEKRGERGDGQIALRLQSFPIVRVWGIPSLT